MSKDVHVKDIDALYGFASDIMSSSSSVGSICSKIHSAIFHAESEQRVYVNRIESALQKAENDLNQARQEYEDYLRRSDEESYNKGYAESLRNDVRWAQNRCDEVKEDLNAARSILMDTKTRLANLAVLTNSFSSTFQSLSNDASDKIKRLAYQVSQYKDVK